MKLDFGNDINSIKLLKVASWGKYVLRAENQKLHYEDRLKKDEIVVTKIYTESTEWLAALYVAIEGWIELKFIDKRIDYLLSNHENFVFIIKQLRNANYHFQKDYIDKRIEKAAHDNQFLIWARILLIQFNRYLFMYPISLEGISEESLLLHQEYLDLIGWVPKDTVLIKWLEIHLDYSQYIEEKNPCLLKRTPENDIKMKDILKKSYEYEAKMFFSDLLKIKITPENFREKTINTVL